MGVDHGHGPGEKGEGYDLPLRVLARENLLYHRDEQVDRREHGAPARHGGALGDEHIADDVHPADVLGHEVRRGGVVAREDVGEIVLLQEVEKAEAAVAHK